MSELAKAAKGKLRALPNHLFEELAMDVYDEVDRRENDAGEYFSVAIWLYYYYFSISHCPNFSSIT